MIIDPEKAAEVFDGGRLRRKMSEGYWCKRWQDALVLQLMLHSTDQVRIDMAQIAAQQLQAVLDWMSKLNVPAEGIDWGGQECCIIGWGSPFDADDHTYKVFGTDKGANYSGYSNELVDEYLTKQHVRQQMRTSERGASIMRQFQKELAKTPAYHIFLLY